MVRLTAKRVLDLVLATLGLVLLSPVMLVTAIAVYLFLKWPIIYTQLRPGLNGKPFLIYKFRSMTNSHDANGLLLPSKQRLSNFGKAIRATSLDELPELWNVIKGDMSLVGPRPLLVEYLARYTPDQARRHQVKPGLTGWAQVNGRNLLSWEERFELDVWYVDNWSLWLDFKILLQTLMTVIRRRGVTPKDASVMTEFKREGCGVIE